MTTREKITAAAFDAFLAEPHIVNSSRRFELIDGVIIEKMPTQLHAYVIGMLAHFLIACLQQSKIGYALPEARYRLPGDVDNDLIPDLSFVVVERGPLTVSGPAPYMPDLAVEVQSDGQSDRFMADKAQLYLRHATRMVWIVYPVRQIVEVLTPTERHLLTAADTLNGGDVLPGFSVPVRDLFPPH
jgi:Uma2 family endonuclease